MNIFSRNKRLERAAQARLLFVFAFTDGSHSRANDDSNSNFNGELIVIGDSSDDIRDARRNRLGDDLSGGATIA